MAKTAYIDILPSELATYYGALSAMDRFVVPRVRKKITLLTRKRIKGLTQKSLLPQVAEYWAGLSEAQKAAWSNAGAQRGLNGWRLFVQDTCARIKQGYEGIATPSTLYQSWVGELLVAEPATELKIVQLHPSTYWVNRKVTGKKGMYEPVVVNENFALPLQISINYKSELTAQGEGAFAKFYASVRRLYQGQNIDQDLVISMDLNHAWETLTNTLSAVTGQGVSYNLYIHLYNVRGNLYIDNVKAIHSGQNWVRDTYCEDLNVDFTRAFYQIPKHWAAVTLPDGSEFDSVYFDI